MSQVEAVNKNYWYSVICGSKQYEIKDMVQLSLLKLCIQIDSFQDTAYPHKGHFDICRLSS